MTGVQTCALPISLQFFLADLSGNPIQGDLRITFQPTANTGGTRMNVEFKDSPATHFTVSNLECRPGPGTLYQVSVDSRNSERIPSSK